ncbi:oligosaccharide flippase family protein [Pseudorhodoferax sp. Leaf274]|uniref:oligosaccharide flippase family protein n=1 Tax=Pseudorhodoferax sp. Leaf274 TaxID=1736318 RepID=UPI000702EA86|nr:oligosaccharide flippase family protein [Pseudorhodoferax sp. Leaf274]KQP39781.1 hypothetical protein ASF44_08630 [Pseudorhodoferax sp. Leaf274]
MASFRKAILINFASSSGATVVQFVVSVLLARLLTPREIGIYSITIVLVNIAHVFREFGVSSYLQREHDLTNEKIRAAMGVAYASTWSIAVLIYACSGAVAAYFGYAEVKPVLEVLALGFLFIPFSSVMLSLLIRDYDAVKIAWASVSGTLAYAVTCLSLAYAGFGTMSLAWANLANIVATGLAYIPMRPRGLPWMPTLRRTAGIFKFGGGALLSNLLQNVNNALPDLILGKIGTANQVGLISRANSTVNMFMNLAGSAINFGSQTYLAKAFHAGQSLEPLLNRSVALVTGIGWPVLAVTAMVGKEIILVLYGKGWVDAVPAVAPLALAAAVSLMFHYNAVAFNAINRPYLSAVPLVFTAVFRIALASLLFSGSVESFAWVLMWATICPMPILLVLQKRYFGCRIGVFLRSLLPSFLVTLACSTACVLSLVAMDRLGLEVPLWRLLWLGVLVGVVWLLALKVFSHPLMDELNVLLKKLRAWVPAYK